MADPTYDGGDNSKQTPSGDGPANPGLDHGHGDPVTIDGTPIVFGETSDRGARFLYMPGEILAWPDDADAVVELLTSELGDDASIEVAEEGPTFVRVAFSSRFSPLDVVDLVTDAGLEATPNHVLRLASHVEFIGVGLPRDGSPSENLKAQFECAAVTKQSPVVAVIDTGIAKASQLPSTVIGVGDFVEANPAPAPTSFGHGTFVAGLIVAECPEAEVRMIRLPYSSPDANGFGHVTDVQLTRALERLIEDADEIDIVNLSLGGFTHDSKPLLASGGAVAELVRRGVTVVAAAGNDGRRGEPFYPAAQDGVLAVGSLNGDGTRSCFSNRGDWVDVMAVGEDVVSAFPATRVAYPPLPAGGPVTCVQVPKSEAHTADFSSGWATWSGTSFAAARVSGALARTRIL